MKNSLKRKQQKKAKRARAVAKKLRLGRERLQRHRKDQRERLQLHAKVEKAKEALKEKGKIVSPQEKAKELETFLRKELGIEKGARFSLDKLWSMAVENKLEITKYVKKETLVKQGILKK